MKIDLDPNIVVKLERAARACGLSPRQLVRAWIEEKLGSTGLDEPGPTEGPDIISSRPCLVPDCGVSALSRGLCTKHYMKYRHHSRGGKLDEGWCVRHGRILPARGKSVQDYAVPEETLATLPARLPNDLPDIRWLFGWPAAQVERARLEGTPEATEA